MTRQPRGAAGGTKTVLAKIAEPKPGHPRTKPQLNKANKMSTTDSSCLEAVTMKRRSRSAASRIPGESSRDFQAK